MITSYLKDTDRFGIVLVEGIAVAEGTDWDYLWGANQPMAGDAFNVTSANVTVNTAGAIDIDADEWIENTQNFEMIFYKKFNYQRKAA
jgi:hypothetical protein